MATRLTSADQQRQHSWWSIGQ